MYKLGLSTCSKPITAQLFADYKKNGIDFAEIALKDYEYDNFDYKGTKALADASGVGLWSFHLPFLPFEKLDISFEDKAVRTHSVNYLSEIIKKAGDIGIDKYIIHPSGEPIEEEMRKERMNLSKESLFMLAKVAKESGGVIAVEDLPRTCLGRNSDDILELISADPSLMVCFDTNHMLSENPADFVRKVGNRIVTTHVSDYDFINERHWLPGEGKNDWNAILDALNEIGYNGVWLYEIDFAAQKTIIRDRNLTCADFAQNAKELFERKAPTVIGTPKENLGMWE